MKRVFLALVLTIAPSFAIAAPTVSGVSADTSTITVSGSNFGDSGPSIVIYDNFNSGTPGNVLSTTATEGSWSASSNSPVYIADTNTAALLVDNDDLRQLQLNFTGVTELFLSYKVKIPTGYNFPETTVSGEFSTGSSWKIAWVMDGWNGYLGDDDICIPTWPNGTYWALTGNDTAFLFEVGRPASGNNWFGFAEWNRFSSWMKAGANPSVDTGTLYSQGMSPSIGIKTFTSTSKVLFDGDDNENDDATSEWSRLNIPGWFGASGTNTRAIYDDIYLATGPNAAARVEVGDNATYTSCTKLDIQTPNSWSDTSIIVDLRNSSFTPGTTAYAFVVDASNVPSTGYAFTVPGGGSPNLSFGKFRIGGALSKIVAE